VIPRHGRQRLRFQRREIEGRKQRLSGRRPLFIEHRKQQDQKNLHERLPRHASTPLNTSVALSVFNRKAFAARVLEVVARAKPRELACDCA
jgi:hypothetical protein